MSERPEDLAKLADYKITISSAGILELLNSAIREVNNPNFQIAGLAFFPITHEENGLFRTYGVRIVVVLWEGNPVEPIIYFGGFDGNMNPQATGIVFTRDRVFNPGVNPDGQPIALVGEGEWERVSVDDRKFAKFNGSGEFDLVFLDIKQCLYLAGIQERHEQNVIIYEVGPRSRYYDRDEEISTRGLQFSRAFFEIDNEMRVTNRVQRGVRFILNSAPEDLIKYRTLKFNPWPLPTTQSYASRSSVAYHIGASCPPLWLPNFIDLSAIFIMEKIVEKSRRYDLIPELPRPPIRLNTWQLLRATKTIFTLVIILCVLLLAALGYAIAKE